MSVSEPLVIAAAPNGARKTPQDHPALPVTADQLADTAAACQGAGAAMCHLHVRDAEGRHSLDPRHYARAVDAIRARVGERLVIQATSESGGVYDPPAQLDAMRALEPESLSLAVREVIGRTEDETAAGEFLAWARAQGIAVQYILYDRGDLDRYRELAARGVIPGTRHWLLFVLGSYAQHRDAAPAELLSFVGADWPDDSPWMVCAFGPREAACALTAAGLGGQVRVGFENNLQLPDGTIAPDNAALVANVADGARALGRPPAGADELRARLAALAAG
ncbi:class III aminotransferase [Rhodovibrio sodomensis]|uniref:Class III aminotransferase n=1 Tax=Rhodovibrio sodomensis TaxID=1088 RepID=A0ABS1D8U8_9PROT|nr:3-keto-5-aminohexanoate cleavage protein [Rhodovibrio sodomensis]MBK1666795.1 class III aminotransferase [Rhodovibrio sodomensis]